MRLKILFFIFSLVTVTKIAFVNGFLGNDIFQTGDERLFELFCVESPEGLAEIGQQTATHESLTKRGIVRSITALFVELKPEFVPPENPTLSQLLQ